MFVFPKPSLSSTDAAEVDELLLNLSIFGFSQLSASEQHEKTKEMYNKVVEDVIVDRLPEESEEDFRDRKFTELFKKLPFLHQNNFLSTVIKKFKHERQIGESISWFSSQLDASDQQEVIRELVHVADDVEILNNEDMRLRRFTQLCNDYPDYVYMHLFTFKQPKKQEEAEETSDDEEEASWDWQSRFNDFFIGFSIIWFKGQSSYDQWHLIQQLCSGVKSAVRIEKIPQESEKDLKLRRFTLLCKQVFDFGVQVHFLDKAEQRLLRRLRYLPHGVLLQPQDSASAAELLSQLSSFGFSLLSPDIQQHAIEQISNKLAAEVVLMERAVGETEEDWRRKTFTKLFNRASVSTQVQIVKEVTNYFWSERRLCDSITLFRNFSSSDQQETIEEMFGRLMRQARKDVKDVKDVIFERLSEESEEDFRLRRFIKLCSTHSFLLYDFIRNEAQKRGLQGLPTSSNEEIEEIIQPRYAEFYIGFSIIWFRMRFANYPRNPVQVLFGVDKKGDHTIEKLPNESEEDFRLRRFRESFKQLQLSYQEDFVKYIQGTVFHDIGCSHNEEKLERRKELKKEEPKGELKKADPNYEASASFAYFYEASPSFASQFIKIKTPNLRGGDVTNTKGGQGQVNSR